MQRNVHFPTEYVWMVFFRDIRHFSTKHAFSHEICIIISRHIGHFTFKCAFFNETRIFFIHRQSTQFLTTLAFSNARGSLHLATNHVLMLFLHSNAHLVFFQRNVHFAMIRAFLNTTRNLRWNVHFATKHAFLSLPRIFRGCGIQMVDVVIFQHNAGDNRLARM